MLAAKPRVRRGEDRGDRDGARLPREDSTEFPCDRLGMTTLAGSGIVRTDAPARAAAERPLELPSFFAGPRSWSSWSRPPRSQSLRPRRAI